MAYDQKMDLVKAAPNAKCQYVELWTMENINELVKRKGS